MKPICNFHTHTELCKHAHGCVQDYVEQAAKENCAALGFSDHCPYPDDFGDYWPDIRMTVEEAHEYTDQIARARASAPFAIYQGYECEWDALYEGWYDELMESFGAEFLVLGSHWVNHGTDHIYICNVESPSLLNKYIDQTIEGMKSGKFAYLAHPDLFMSGQKEWDDQARACSQAILDAAVDLDLPIEINGLGINRRPRNTKRGMRYPYPFVEFWEMAAMTNVRVICNSDAHDPHDVILNAWKARDFASRFGIEPIEKLDFQN